MKPLATTSVSNYYLVLDVYRASKPEDITYAYRMLASRLHPDKGGDMAAFAALNKAQEVLRNSVLRRHYEKQLDAMGRECHRCAGQGYKVLFRARLTKERCPECQGMGRLGLNVMIQPTTLIATCKEASISPALSPEKPPSSAARRKVQQQVNFGGRKSRS